MALLSLFASIIGLPSSHETTSGWHLPRNQPWQMSGENQVSQWQQHFARNISRLFCLEKDNLYKSGHSNLKPYRRPMLRMLDCWTASCRFFTIRIYLLHWAQKCGGEKKIPCSLIMGPRSGLSFVLRRFADLNCDQNSSNGGSFFDLLRHGHPAM